MKRGERMESVDPRRSGISEPKFAPVSVPRCGRCLKVQREGRTSKYCRACLWRTVAVRVAAVLGIAGIIFAVAYFIIASEEPPPVLWIE